MCDRALTVCIYFSNSRSAAAEATRGARLTIAADSLYRQDRSTTAVVERNRRQENEAV